MYGLPADFDPTVFVGRRLEAVTFAENVIVLAFGDGCTVSISGAVRYQLKPDLPPTTEKAPVSQSSLVALVGRKVLATDLRSPRELTLALESGGSLTLLDESEQFESYLLEVDGSTVVV